MFDVHCHMLPAMDDGARHVEMALAMARMAVDDGITHLACTPHIYPGLFENDAQGIAKAVDTFAQLLQEQDIPLQLAHGADIQVVPELLPRLRTGVFPTINGSRYFLFEPPHHVPLMNFSRFVSDVLSAGLVPVITHPERLTWLGEHYEEFLGAACKGAWIQLTAGSLTGRFGSAPRYWAEKMLDDGVVHLLATDAHNTRSRPPLLAEGEAAAARVLGREEARLLVYNRPGAIWKNEDPVQVPLPPALSDGFRGKNKKRPKKTGLLNRLLRRRG
ncbi:tyrosine-protein phosphatase [Thiolapillus brandeum]|uniref:protein-tyrosine-phosphatase n=1 Tax=Thiolapillus brandeum TaxID=1076588 RepID=A0A7U6GHE1_9GAMM|nr:CpsB/CapC family capsule biosynthesis tyrosine phosphatase [Thiolapillus brandeum]BAO43665.1 protein-tyrosine phosphatase [Thiolapillus brandeum]